MSTYSKESLETLRQRIDLVEVISPQVELKRAGAAYKGLCPFHDEKTPSFTIQKGDSYYHCFGCGAHGDAIRFLMDHQKLSFIESVENLAQRFNVYLEKSDTLYEAKGPSKGLLKEALEQASRFYHFCLLYSAEGHEALKYLYSRGIDLEFIRYFRIGLAPKSSGVFRTVMASKGIKEEIMIAAGLLGRTQDGNVRNFFYDRILFPIQHHIHGVIGFSGRKYKEETTGGKYVNSPETALFKKSRVLFGLNYCRRRIAKERRAIIVEGQIDALRLIQEGFNIAVAGQGTAFGDEHAQELIALGINQAYLALDADAAGKEAANKIGQIFQKEGVEVKIVPLPAGYDPDQFLRERGPAAFLQLMDKSVDFLSFMIAYHSRSINTNSPAGKNELIQVLVGQIRQWNHPLMVHEALRKLAHTMSVPEDLIGVGQNYVPNIYIKKTASIGMQTVDPDRILEGDLLRWILLIGDKQPQYVEMIKASLNMEDFRSPLCQKIYRILIESHDNRQPYDLLGLSIEFDQGDEQQFVFGLLDKKVSKDRCEEQVTETIQKILDRNWMETREEIKMKLQSGKSSHEEAIELAKQFDALKRNPRQVIKN